MQTWILKILLALSVSIAVLIALNFNFFKAQLDYYFNKPDLSAQQQVSKETEATQEPNKLHIPALGVTAPIIYAEKVLESHFQEKLQDGVVHFPQTALPGEPGNVYIFGHSSDFAFSEGDYKTVFALLPKIKEGESIFITNSEGKEFEYKVIESKVVNNNDLSVLDQQGNTKKLLTLQTSYPVGTALRRFVAIAELVEK